MYVEINILVIYKLHSAEIMGKIIVQTVVKNHPKMVYVISDFIWALLYL